MAALPPFGGAEGSTIVNDLMSEHDTSVRVRVRVRVWG